NSRFLVTIFGVVTALGRSVLSTRGAVTAGTGAVPRGTAAGGGTASASRADEWSSSDWIIWRLPRFLLSEHDPGEDVEKEDGDRDEERAGPGEVLPVLVRAHGELEDHHRQVGERRVHVARPELVVERGEEEGRRLAADARDGEQHA